MGIGSEAKFKNLIEELANIVGPKYVSDDPFVRWSYSMDSSILDREAIPPAVVVRPRTIEEIQEIIRLANRTRTPVYVRGGGTSGAGTRGPKIASSILIDTTRMNDIVEIDEMAITVTVQAGITWGKLNAELAKKGWRLGVKGTYSGYGATVGGGVAYNSVGMASSRYGLIAEEVMCLNVVLPNGDILKTGTAINPHSRRYYRYCIGPDLTGLFIGSLGTLGVITEVTLRIYPKTEYTTYGAYAFKDYESAQKCYHEWLKHQLLAEDIAWYAEDGLNVMVPEVAEQGYVSMLTYVVEDSTEELVEARKKLLDKIAEENGGSPQNPDYARIGWEYMFETLPRWAGKIGMWQWTCHLMSAGDAVRDLLSVLNYIKSREKECKREKVYSATISVSERNCGHVSTSLYYDEGNPESVKLAWEMMNNIVKIAAESGGCPYKPGKIWYPYTIMKNPVYRETLIKIKKSLDPNNIMNPGALTIPEE